MDDTGCIISIYLQHFKRKQGNNDNFVRFCILSKANLWIFVYVFSLTLNISPTVNLNYLLHLN